MAQTGTIKLGPTGNAVIDALTNGTYWVLGPDRTLTWAVADQPSPDWKWNATGAAMMQDAMGLVLAEFASVANIRFQYTAWYDDLRGAPADIVLSATGLPWLFGMPNSTYAWAYFPNEAMSDPQAAYRFGASYSNSAGDVILNLFNGEMYNSNFAPGSQGFFALLHETGHALGLKHPHDNGGTPGRPTFFQLGYSLADTQILTIMSYNPATSLAYWLQQFGLPANSGYPQTLMPLDVLALQSIYGPNTTTRAGNDVYRLFNDNAIQTFWDAGGIDTVTAAESGFGWNIIAVGGGAEGNLVVAVPSGSAYETGKFYFNIERFEGSQFADSIVGTNSANAIYGRAGNDQIGGGGGNDEIDGGAGLDTAIYVGPRNDYGLRRVGDFWSVEGRAGQDGVDVLANVERTFFADFSVALDTYAGGNAYFAAIVVRALEGREYLRDRSEVGAALSLLDTGTSLAELVALIVTSNDFARMAGSRSNTDFVKFVYENVVGFAPGPGDLSYYVGLLDSRQFTQSSLGLLAVTVDVNTLSADIVGLAQTGIEFELFSG
jgi:serralysin